MKRWGRDRDVRPLSDVLPRTDAFRRAPVPPGLGSAWAEALGAASRHTVLERFVGGVLIVKTESSDWTLEVEALADELAERLRERGHAVERVEVLGPRGKQR